MLIMSCCLFTFWKLPRAFIIGQIYKNYFKDFVKVYCSMALLDQDQGMINISDMRKPYKGKEEALRESLLTVKEPFGLFEEWFNLACKTDGILEANAMALATADKSGRPSNRYVLLKGYGKKGFRFFTNHSSRKGRELAENPFASLVFYWEPLCRQIRLEGPVERLTEQESEIYFHSRPQSSQISAVVSKQSSVIESREVLIKEKESLEAMHSDPKMVIPKPVYWGGYCLIPEVFEFWQGHTDRLHDRIRFRRPAEGEKLDENLSSKGEDGWIYERLSP